MTAAMQPANHQAYAPAAGACGNVLTQRLRNGCAVTDRQAPGKARAELGAELAAYRRAAGYTQARLAQLTGYSRGTIANVETGRQHVPATIGTAASCQRASRSRCPGGATAAPPLLRVRDLLRRPQPLPRRGPAHRSPDRNPPEALDTAYTIHLAALGHQPGPDPTTN
jgi:DNA-binding XRE family transcriptional regulator